MSLVKEIEEASVQIATDSYDMSVGEIVNLYKEKEIIINPSFQRLYRWTLYQKSHFIESLMLGIPVPPIFVFETEKGSWELIDGLQRLSTVLEFMGILRNHEGGIYPPLTLSGTKYLPSLDGYMWEGTKGIKKFDKPQQISLKRAKIGVQILRKKSDEKAKFDLFQRLNSHASVAKPQELRNCIMVMLNPDSFSWMDSLSKYKYFKDIMQQTERAVNEQSLMDYLTRFFVFSYVEYDKNLDIEEYLDTGIIDVVNDIFPNKDFVEDNFKQTFDMLYGVFGEKALKRHDGNEFRGRVGQAAFEVIALGISHNLEKIKGKRNYKSFLEKRIKDFWETEESSSFSAAGLRGTQRIQKTIPFGQKWFKP